MQAVVQDRYGPPEVLELRDVPRPRIGDDGVLVRVRAAGLDRGVWHVMTGLPYLIRIMGYGLRAPRSPVRGYDLAGTVEAVGARVTRFTAGDAVFGACDGSFAEYAAAKERDLAAKPGNVTFEQAAAVPISGVTALQGVRDHGLVRDGQRVLILGASGGVGTFAVQIARALGAHVTGVCSTGKMDLVRSLGADHVVDYTREDVTRAGTRYDVILDIGGNRPLSGLRRILAERGTLVIVGGEAGDRWIGGTDRLLRALLLDRFVRQRLRGFIAAVRPEDLETLRDYLERGTIAPVIDRTFPLGEAAAAVRHLAEGRARGKVVLTVP